MFRKMEKYIKKLIAQFVFTCIHITKTVFLMNNSYGSCKYEPSCSLYAKEAIEKLPVYKAAIKIIWRVIRCNPLSKGGFDPVIK